MTHRSQKSEPSFDIRIKASSDEDVALTLGVVLTATYPKTPPLLTVRSHDTLRESTLFKVQKYLETKPKLFATEEQEMVDRIVEGIREVLEDAAQAKAAGLELPSLEEERAAHEMALAKIAQDQKEQEERKKQEETKEEERVLGDMLQEELKRQKAKARDARKKNRANMSPERVPEDYKDPEVERIVFDQPCKLTDSTGNTVFFTTVTGKSQFRSGPVSTVYIVRPVLSIRQDRPSLALKLSELHSSGKDAAQFKKQLQSLEVQLESMKKLRHRHILDLLDFRVDRVAVENDTSAPTSWHVSVLCPLAEKGPLEELLDLAGHLDVSKVRSWTTDLLDALGFLHSHGVLHQNIHPGNILLVRESTGDVVPKLADAGYQRELHNICTKTQTVTSMRAAKSAYWFPPEIAGVSKPQYTQKTDIWDFGVVFLQMIFGLDVLHKYHSPLDLMNTLDLSSPLEELVSKFFKADPKKRPRAFELSSSEFLATDAPILVEDSSAIISGSLIMPQNFPPRSRHDSTNVRGVVSSRYREDFVEEGRLGKGGFGEVVKARKKLDGQIYAIKKITQRSQAGLTEILKEVRLLSQLSHPAVVRYYNTWLEEIPDFSDTEGETSTEGVNTEGSQGTFSQGVDVEFATSKGGLDFMSSSGYPQVEFGFDDTEGESDDDDEELDESSGSESESETGGDGEINGQVALPDRRRLRRHSTRPFRTVMYISMEYCEKRVSKYAGFLWA